MLTVPFLRVALIGQGFMGRAHSNAYRQVRRFFDVPYDIDCRVLCGRNPATLERTAAVWGWRDVATDWRAVIDRKDVDLVDIVTPNPLHAPIAIAAAQAGKMVLCEKPLATSAEEGARMVAAARAVPNGVWFNYRRAPSVAFARQLIDDGRLGQVFHYRATYLQQWGNDPTRIGSWKVQKDGAGSGALGDLASHLVDTAMWLNGPISNLSALLHTFTPGRDVDDAALFLARFANGSLGTFEATRYAIGCRNRNAFEIHGARGMLGFNLEDMNHLQFVDATEPPELQGPRNLLTNNPYWKPGHLIGYEHTFTSTLADFLKSLAGGEPFHPDFEDAQQTQFVLEAVERSATSGGTATTPATAPR
jgi:predicted dehydrogenase